MSARVVVAGIGSDFRHDDGIGPALAGLVAQAIGDAADVGPIGEPLDLLGRWDGAGLAIVIDATRSGSTPGTVRTIELDSPHPVPGSASEPAASRRRVTSREPERPGATSTHSMGVAGVLRIARAVGGAPDRVVLVGIEGSDFTPGLGFTPGVSDALAPALKTVLDIVKGDIVKGDIVKGDIVKGDIVKGAEKPCA